MAEALYRKYRPQIFEDVVGQEHIERTIKNAIAQDKLSHAYLFTGPRGTGKTTTARLLAKALLCEKGPTAEPDGTCADCRMIADGEHPDVYELDAASRTGVENVREEIIGRVQFAPTRGRYKIYIIDEVHMLSTAAFNALLKTLEEPPSHVVFILATTDPQKVPETIHSRCQRFDFRRISLEAIVSRLGAICVAEGVDFEGEALDLVAHRAEGGMRNALTSLEQLIAFGDGRVTLEVAERMLGSLDSNDLAEIARFVGARDVASCFRWTAQFVETGADLAQFTRDFAERVRNLYVMSLAGADVALEVGEAARREMADELRLFGPDRLARLLGVLGDLTAELKTSTNPRLSFEIALTRMVRPDSDLTLESLAERIEALESGYSAVAHVSAGAPVPAVAPAAAPAVPAPAATATAVASGPATAPTVSEPVVRAAAASAPAVLSADPCEEAFTAASRVEPLYEAGAAGVTGRKSDLANPAVLQRMWQSALALLKKEKAAYGVLFMSAKAVFNDADQRLVIEFPPDSSFAFKTVQKPDIQKALEDAIAKACGERVPFSLFSGPASAVQPATRAAAQSAVVRPADRSAAQPVARSAAQPAIQSAVAQPAPAASVVAPEPDPVPYDDVVPIDVYDDVVPLEAYGDYAPYAEIEEDTAPKNAAPESAASAMPAAPKSTASEGSASKGNMDELQAMLAQSFGAAVVFQEINE